MSSPVLLAIETSQRQGGVALRDAAGQMHVEMLREAARHDDDLMPAVDRVLDEAGLIPGDLDAVGVSIGPGGFTGLRIAVTTAKMLAETLSLKVLAVPSALVVARSHVRDDGPIMVALASKRNSAWITRLIKEDDIWMIEGVPGLVEAPMLNLQGITTLIGDRHLPESMRAEASRQNVQLEEPVFDPAACLVLAEELVASGRTTDPLQLSPLYPRPPEAASLWEQRKRSG